MEAISPLFFFIGYVLSLPPPVQVDNKWRERGLLNSLLPPSVGPRFHSAWELITALIVGNKNEEQGDVVSFVKEMVTQLLGLRSLLDSPVVA